MNEALRMLVIVCPLIFVAGFVDAVAGGGGVISLPAYFLGGLPVHIAAGTNKLSAGCGTIIAAIKYLRDGKVKIRIAVFSAIGAVCGSTIGTSLALFISEQLLKGIMLVAIPLVAIFLVTQKNIGKETVEKEMSVSRQSILATLIGLVIGCYDGLIGPGTGTFLILAFTALLGLELVTSSGCAKVSNLASNITSMIIYVLNGKVLFWLAIPAAICAMLGGYAGARFAIKGGAKNVRYVMFVVLILLFGKTFLELI
ncbi:MAG: sulfite exporter TauE/SafE family protein [Cellulosilyticum sp.]|nr:sulfite exporter TauE/SafE family protein [Cellulosilyticum sp.]